LEWPLPAARRVAVIPRFAAAGYTRGMSTRRLLAVTALVLVLAACGNKGPLTLSQKADEPPVPAAAPETTPAAAPATAPEATPPATPAAAPEATPPATPPR
jgi:predicted small lipoprotein YifL